MFILDTCILITCTLYYTIYRYLAEQDLLGSTSSSSSSTPSPPPPYELRNTGQGLQRVQQSPLVYRAMHEILARTKHQLGGWVGSSVIHLGDNNVPNTLMFIDKYTQVPRILGPLIKTLENLEQACSNNEGLNRYMLAYGGIDKAKKVCIMHYCTVLYLLYCTIKFIIRAVLYSMHHTIHTILICILYYTPGHTARFFHPRVRRQRRGQLLRRRQLHRRQTHIRLELVSIRCMCMCILYYVIIVYVYVYYVIVLLLYC